MRGGVPLEVVGEERSDRPLDHPVREDLAEFLREKGDGDELGRLGIDGDRLELGVNAPGEIPSDDGVFPLEVFKGKVAGLSEPAARVLAEVNAAQLLRAGSGIKEKPRLPPLAGDPQSGSRGRLMEHILLGLGGAEGRNARFRES
jgi:hypothetical protein